MAKTTKRALLLSVLAVVMCIVMLIGTTFAWFTDTASTGVNKIVAGNLDVELEYSTDCSNWAKVTDTTKLFAEDTLWEPGRTEVVYLRVKNAGSLALKFNIGLYNLYDYSGRNINNAKYKLSDHVKLGVAETAAKYTTREDSVAAVSAEAKTLTDINAGTGSIIGPKEMVVLNSKDVKTYALVLYMPTEVGNEANPKSASWAAKVSFGISVFASQAAVESDSFGSDYDEQAPVVITAQSSTYKTYEITENIQANGRYGAVQVEGSQVTINADVYAVYNSDAAMAVLCGGSGKVIINGGDFRQVGVPASDPDCDLIYARDNGQIEIHGGTFKAVTPANTLNVFDADQGKAKIVVYGGSFYQYDPSHPTMGEGEVEVPAGYHVEQNGDWYTVVSD